MTEDGPEPDDDPEEPAAEDNPPDEGEDSAPVEGEDPDAERVVGSGAEDRPVGEDAGFGSADRDADADEHRDRGQDRSGGGDERGADATESVADAARDGEAEEGRIQPGQSTQRDTPPAEGTAAGDAADSSPGATAGADDRGAEEPPAEGGPAEAHDDVPEDVRSYDRFQKMDRAGYDRVNEFLRDRTYITAREWAIARLCADFRTATGVEMTKIGEHLPELVPFMTDTYSPQAVNQARSAFERKVRMAGATFLYGAMSGFFTADELDDLMYEVTEVAKFLLEVEGVELAVEEELAAEDRISSVMREVREASEQLRYDDVECPHCGEAFRPAETD